MKATKKTKQKKAGPLRNYSVTIMYPVTASQVVYVEAKSVEEAKKLAMDDTINHDWDYDFAPEEGAIIQVEDEGNVAPEEG